MVEARRFGAAVTGLLEQTANIELVSPASVRDIEIGGPSSKLHLDTGQGTDELEARLVVAADGAGSFIRNHLQIPTQIRDYGQTAVICNITPEISHDGRAFECLTDTGPFAVLPHTGKRCGLVWSVATEAATEILNLDDEAFLARAQMRFGKQLGALIQVGKRTAYPLKLVRATEDVRERLVILGNAAHAIHPIGAQGFNLALRDAAVLAEILADDDLGDPGETGLLHTYSAWRTAGSARNYCNFRWYDPAFFSSLTNSCRTADNGFDRACDIAIPSSLFGHQGNGLSGQGAAPGTG